ncbi:MAG: quinone-dependent dihydroorotate dehydrogenase [Rikenellaceae bacterium]|nr:quinone-dependent dihydroorotate dehydrogenase [Rikenellaceae bacterium]
MFGLLSFLSPLIGAERAHNWALVLLGLLGKIPGAKWFMRKLYAVEHSSLERDVFGIHFRNPVGMAAGFDRNGDIFKELGALGFGFVEIGTVTPEPQQGNPKPRVFRLDDDRAIMNRVGLSSKGLESVVANLRENNGEVVIGCNIGKNSTTAPEDAPHDYLRVFRNLYQYVDYFSVNVSYNTSFKQYVPRTRESIISILEPLFDFRRGQNQYRPILLKISPDLTDEDIDMMTDIMVDTPLDGIVATNGTVRHTGLKTEAQTMKRYGAGAVSGSPLTKRSVEVVRRIYKRSNGTYPIIGVGGIMTPADAKAMLDAGATLVQVYTGYVYNGPSFVGEICKHLRTS